MEELFSKPILDQMYEFRREDYDDFMYKNNTYIKEKASKAGRLLEKLFDFLKEVIPNEKDFNKADEIFTSFDEETCQINVFWNKEYYKLGIKDGVKLVNEVSKKEPKIENKETFIEYNNADELLNYIEEQKSKYISKIDKYKELTDRYGKISKKYPKAIDVFENSNPIILNEEEMKALIELQEIDAKEESIEKVLCFKLGMNEILNFDI